MHIKNTAQHCTMQKVTCHAFYHVLVITNMIYTYTVSQKKCAKLFLSELRQRWQRGTNYARYTHFPPHLIHVTTLPC